MADIATELIAQLRRNPDDSAAFFALRAHYQRIGDHASLANLLEGWAGRALDNAAAAQAYFEAAELVVSSLGHRERAIALYERALERNVAHFDASARLQTLLEEAHDFRRVTELLERRIEALTAVHADPRHIAAVHQQLGTILEQRTERPDRAILHYRRAFELDPTLVPAIYAARTIYRNAGNLRAAATLYDLEANAEADPVRKIALLRELAGLRSERLADYEGAVVALKRALGLAPGDLSVMHDLAVTLLTRAEHANPPEAGIPDRRWAADLFFQAAQSVPREHALGYAEAALNAAPDHDGALALYEQLIQGTEHEASLPLRWVAFLQVSPDVPHAKEVRQKLSQAYVSAGQFEDAIVCLEPLLHGGDPDAAQTLVELYTRVGRPDDAVRAMGAVMQGLPPKKRVPRLREIVHVLAAQGDPDGAATSAREILAIEPGDPEALAYLEDYCRARNDFHQLRDIMLAAARVPGLPIDARKHRLTEVAAISEVKLGDIEGAIGAWRAITALDPTDSESRHMLKRLLEKAGRWDDVVQVLDREALASPDPMAKAEIFLELARVHFNHRGDLSGAIEAFRHVREIRPDDVSARDGLSDALIAAGAYLEALPLLRKRIETTRGNERAKLLRVLAAMLEDHLDDYDGAYDASAQLLDEEPGDIESLDRMERIDIRTGRKDRLIQILSYRAEISTDDERADILVRMAQIADRDLGDLDRAAEYYAKAIEINPSFTRVLPELCDVYDRAGRYKDLVVLLRNHAHREQDPAVRAELYRRIAHTLTARVRNDEAASEAWEEVLKCGEDEEALRALRAMAAKRDQVERLQDLTGRLAAVVSDDDERRDLLIERSTLLSDRLDRKDEAIGILRDVVTRVDPSHVPALLHLAALCEAKGDKLGLADALERQLVTTDDSGLRLPVAQRLADLYQHDLGDRPRAIRALHAWAELDALDPEPWRRLLVLLELTRRWNELIECLDRLASLERDSEVVSAIVLRAADIAVHQLGDVEGGWKRLVNQVEDGDAKAEEALRSLAFEAARGEALAELYINLAQATDDPDVQRRRWMDASRAFEEYLGDAERALEATLRAFALDLNDETYLDEADRLAAKSGAWQRLSQVYDTLLRQTEDDDHKVELLMRYAERLDHDGGDPGSALDRVMQATAIVPHSKEVLARAEELAPRVGRAEELLVVYDRKRASAESDEDRLDALLRSAKLALSLLEDADQTTYFFAQSVALSVLRPELLDLVEAAARDLDISRGTGTTTRDLLVSVYRQLADDSDGDAATGAYLMYRASRILMSELNDLPGALEAAKEAAALSEGDAAILDHLEQLAQSADALDVLDAELEQLAVDALEPKTAATLLRRRGRLLEERFGRFSEAADVYSRLVIVDPSDDGSVERLHSCLRRAGRHQDLLIEIDRELERTANRDRKLELYRELARTWDYEIKNRWEALEAWKKVLLVSPGEQEAARAVERLELAIRESVPEDTGAVLVPEEFGTTQEERSIHELPPIEDADLGIPIDTTDEEPSLPSAELGPFDLVEETSSVSQFDDFEEPDNQTHVTEPGIAPALLASPKRDSAKPPQTHSREKGKRAGTSPGGRKKKARAKRKNEDESVEVRVESTRPPARSVPPPPPVAAKQPTRKRS